MAPSRMLGAGAIVALLAGLAVVGVVDLGAVVVGLAAW